MASAVIHLAVAKELEKEFNIKNRKDYYLGSIAPDIAKQIGETKDKSHFIINTDKDIPNLDIYTTKYRKFKKNDFELGYIWYSSENDTKTLVVTDTNTYHEVINMREHEEGVDEEIIVRSLRQPSCIKADIEGDNITYTIEKELGIELVGDIKVKIEANLDEDPWDEIEDTSNDNVKNNESSSNIDDVNENFIEEETI